MKANANSLAFDFGGTKLAAALIRPADGMILAEERCATPSAQGAQACVQAMLSMGDRLLERMPTDDDAPCGVGISFGGPVSSDRRTCVKSQHVSGWDTFPMIDLVEAHYQLPARMDNDANLAALGSWYYDAQHLPENFFYVQASTGIGGGLVLNRRLYRGGGVAGEMGHFLVEGNQRPCVCGNTGCLETLCAGWGIVQQAREVLQTTPIGQWQTALIPDLETMSAKQVIQAAIGGNDLLLALLQRSFTSFGIALSHVIAITDVEMVILGGGIFRARELLGPFVLSAAEKHLPPYMQKRCRIAFSTLEGRETLLGAALLSAGLAE